MCKLERMGIEDRLNFSGFQDTKLISELTSINNVEVFKLPASINLDFTLNLSPRLMLGKRAEKYFSCWIEESEEYEMILENIQVFDEKITLGEFDFILNSVATNQLIHVELVYKFYLLDPSIEDSLAQWVGPNRNDSLALKMQKLRFKQFPLLHSKEGRHTLSNHTIDSKNVKQQLAFFHNLFLPFSVRNPAHNLNPDAFAGYWYSVDEFRSNNNEGDLYFIPQKVNWFMRVASNVTWLDMDAILEELLSNLNNQKSPMIWKLNCKGVFERLFVVWW